MHLDARRAAAIVRRRDDELVDQGPGCFDGLGGVGALQRLMKPFHSVAIDQGQAGMERGQLHGRLDLRCP